MEVGFEINTVNAHKSEDIAVVVIAFWYLL